MGGRFEIVIKVICLERIEFENKMRSIIASMKSAGYNPFDQLTGYLQTGDDNFITRTGDARALIRTLYKAQIAEYLEKNKSL